MSVIDEWVIRIAGALLLINIFSMGIYLCLRGMYKYKTLNKMRRVEGKIHRISRFFRASVTWFWRGQEVLAVDPSLFAISRRETISLFITPDGMNFHLNIWTHNGKGLIAMGGSLCLLASVLALILV